MTALFAAALIGQSNPSIKDFYQTQFQDAAFRIKRVSDSQKELQKINKDFAQFYRFDYIDVQMKEPFMLRTESVVDRQSVVYILNGGKRRYEVPSAKIHTTQDISLEPGKRQTTLDFGLLTPSLFEDFFIAKFVRKDRESGDMVFDFTYVPKLTDASRHRVWIDPETKAVKKREWYSQQDGRLMAIFTYEGIKKFGNVWMPTKLSVKNADNKSAGVSEYASMEVNKGIPASVFKI